MIYKVRMNNGKMKEEHIEDLRTSDDETEQTSQKLIKFISEGI